MDTKRIKKELLDLAKKSRESRLERIAKYIIQESDIHEVAIKFHKTRLEMLQQALEAVEANDEDKARELIEKFEGKINSKLGTLFYETN